MAIKRQGPRSPRNAQRTVVAGVVGAAAFGALLAPAATASAAPVTVPGVGSFDVPDEVLDQIPPGAVPPGVLPPGVEIPGVDVPGVDVPGAPPESAPAPGQGVGQEAADAAMSRVGAPYSYGATGPDAFDCSGLVQWAYEQAGVELPRTSYAQLDTGSPVSSDALQPGDVVSFYGGDHSGLYVGDGNIVHASTAGQPVSVVPVASMPIAGARRI